jgi:hypothetical protein
VNPITRSTRKGLIALALLAALVVPQTTLAASQTGDTTESGISVAVTLSAVFPASTATYTLTAGVWSYSGSITSINTNNTTGVQITVKADVYSGPGGATVPTTARALTYGAQTGGLGDATLTCSGNGTDIASFANTTTAYTLACSHTTVTNGSRAFTYNAQASAFSASPAGSYTSAVHYTAVTL